MNKYEKLVQKQFINDEEKIIKRLKSVYNQSLKDINGKVAELDKSISTLQKVYNSVGDDEIGDLAAAFLKSNQIMTPEEAKETLQSMIQSKVYQKKYQEALKKQVGGVLDTMQAKEFKAVSDYLTECYENGFVGAMYDLQGQGIPLCFPMDQEAMVRAVQLDSKISKGLYQRLGEDVDLLKRKITAQVSRGISSGLTFKQVAQELAGTTNIGFNNAVRIARTEGHRIQCQAGMDACYKAKEKGADVLKQWDSALDSRTRESHTIVDGEIRELDEKFSNGLMYPGDPSGGAAEVVNCRCALLQRARWALDEDELQTLKDRAAYYGLDKTDNFEDFKAKYLKAAESIENAKHEPLNAEMAEKRLAVADYMRSLGAEVDDDGMVTLYHATAKENVSKIEKNGFKPTSAPINGSMTETVGDRVFFGYDKQWISDTWSNDGAYDIMKVKIPAEYLHQAGQNKLEVFIEGTIKQGADGVWVSDVLPTSTAWDRMRVKRWQKKNPSNILTNNSNSGIMQMDNAAVRKWYVDKVSKITEGIDKSLPIEQQAMEAFKARNAIRTEARNMMSDQETRKLLDKEHPNKTFEELIESKMKRKGMTREEAIQDIYDTATKSNKDINKELGLDGD